MKKYVLELNWQARSMDMNFSLQDMLRYAQLPSDLLERTPLLVTAEEFFKLWHGIEYVMRDIPAFPLYIGKSLSPETFSPPIFASLCSRDLNSALKRMIKYKPLVGPVRLQIVQDESHTRAEFVGIAGYEQLPPTLVMAELVFWVQVARIATREHMSRQGCHNLCRRF